MYIYKLYHIYMCVRVNIYIYIIYIYMSVCVKKVTVQHPHHIHQQ
jgi:hypothetical protein